LKKKSVAFACGLAFVAAAARAQDALPSWNDTAPKKAIAGAVLDQVARAHSPRRDLNGIQSHEDLFVTLAAAAGLPNLKEDLLKGYKMNGTNYKVHLDGYNNLDYWTGKTEKSARNEIFYYDETDLMAIRVNAWKMDIGVKHHGIWWDEKSYPSVAYLTNLLMDPMEKVTPDSGEWQYEGRKFMAAKLWAPTAAGPFLTAHLKSLQDFPPRQGADTLSMKGDRRGYEETGERKREQQLSTPIWSPMVACRNLKAAGQVAPRFAAKTVVGCSSVSNRCLKLNKRSQLFICTHNETLPVAAMRVSSKDCSPLRIDG
jgi:hypothetical protein